jgi:Na+-driven multidrug efflux pump
VDEFIRNTVLTVIIIVGAAQPIKMLNGVNIVGILRSGGETKFAMFLEIVSLWFIGVPLVAITGLVFKLPITAVYVCTIVEEIFKIILGMKRYRSGKWIKNLINE